MTPLPFLLTALLQQDTVQDWTVAEGRVSQPQVAVSVQDGRFGYHVAYAREGRQVVVRSRAPNAVAGDEVLLKGAVTQAGMRRGPRIAAGPRGLCVSAIVFDREQKREGDLMSWVSGDGGLSFEGPFPVTDQPAAAREGLHDMAASADGTLACVWLDLRHGKTEVYASFSADGGRAWTPNALVYRSPDGTVCECCAPAASFDGKGRLHVLFRNSLDGKRDMWLASGTESAFVPAVKLGQGSWTLAGCPMAPGGIVPGRKAPLSFWSREDKLFRCAAGGEEEMLGQGKELAAGGGTAGAYLAWIEGGAAGDLKLLVPSEKAARSIASRAHWPALSAAPDAQWPLALVWEEHGTESIALKLRVLAGGSPPATPK